MGYSDSEGWARVFDALEAEGDFEFGNIQHVYDAIIAQLERMDFDVWDELVELRPRDYELHDVLRQRGNICSHPNTICADCGVEV